MNRRRTSILAGVFGAFALVSCTTSNDSVCEDLESWLDNRARELDRGCETNDDCQLVYIRPDEPVAASIFVEDAYLRRVRREFSEECAEPLYGSGVEFIPATDARVEVACRDEVGEEIDQDGSSSEYVIGRICSIVGSYAPPPRVDAGNDDAGVADACSCSTNAECSPGLCVGCACVDAGPCATVCARVFDCGVSDDLNLGTTGFACTEACEARVASDPAFNANAVGVCASNAQCANVVDCL
jgi:hypothetical protein